MNYIIHLLFIILLILFMISFALLYLSITKKLLLRSKKTNYTEILPNLFLGNIDSAQDSKFIKKQNIQVIINCSNNIEHYFLYNTNIKYYRCPIDDSLLDYDINLMKDYLPKFVNIIEEALNNNKPVLVHCYAGRQRSAVVIAAYLMYKKGLSIEEAYKYIISKRPEAFHYGRSFNFNKSLKYYEIYHL